jgi:hypothetical protein
MSSARRIAANRHNAQQSRGPRTPAGKAHVSRNALRHGLAVSIFRDPAVSAEVDRLARALADSDKDNALLGLARIIAEAELDLARIQITKVSLMNSHLGAVSPPATSPGAELVGEARVHEVEPYSDRTGTAMIDALPQLVRLHRYERRARSRLTRAISIFQARKAISTADQ